MAVESAGKILLVAGVLNLAFGVVTGYAMSLVRPALLGLVIAIGFSQMSSGTETRAAWLLVAEMGESR